MVARLIERHSGRLGPVHMLTAVVTTIGRGADNDIILAGAYVSARHAQVCWDGRHYVLNDCGSTNGTDLNDARLAAPRCLCGGDRISVPGHPDVTLVFEDGCGTAKLPVAHPAEAVWRLDPATAELWVRGVPVSLSAKEYRALALLDARRGALVSKDELAAHVWPEYDGAVADDNLTQLVARLRRKLEGDGVRPPLLVTVRGLGYRLVVG
ncbi:MAG: winged helix-turn-helix domain-containing protein [Dehalococcoidia bacterium]